MLNRCSKIVLPQVSVQRFSQDRGFGSILALRQKPQAFKLGAAVEIGFENHVFLRGKPSLVSPLLFGAIQILLCQPQDILDIGGVLGIQNHSGAASNLGRVRRHLFLGPVSQLVRQLAANFFRENEGLFEAQVFGDDEKLVSPATERLMRPSEAGEGFFRPRENRLPEAGSLSRGGRPKVVDVQDDAGDSSLIAPGERQLSF